MRLNKKGEEMHGAAIAGALAILLIFAGLYLGFQGRTKNIFIDISEAEACRTSVVAKATIKPPTGQESPFELNCKTSNVKLKSKEKSEIIKALADNMQACWWKLGEGKLDFLSEYDFFGSDTRCFICSKISSEEFKDKINGAELANFLNKEKVNNPLKKEQRTYAEYFLGQKGAFLPTQNNDLDLGQPLYSVFFANKKSVIEQNLIAGGAGVVLLGVGTFLTGGFLTMGAGAGLMLFGLSYSPEFISVIGLSNADVIIEKCDTLE